SSGIRCNLVAISNGLAGARREYRNSARRGRRARDHQRDRRRTRGMKRGRPRVSAACESVNLPDSDAGARLHRLYRRAMACLTTLGTFVLEALATSRATARMVAASRHIESRLALPAWSRALPKSDVVGGRPT